MQAFLIVTPDPFVEIVLQLRDCANDDRAVAAMLNLCGFGVILSESEGSAFAFAEYLLCGLPMVPYSASAGAGFFS